MDKVELPPKKIDPYVATEDMVDALKLEVSAVSPKIDRMVVQEAARRVRDAVLTKYKDFIPEETVKRTQNTHGRTIMTDSENFHQLYQHWSSSEDKMDVVPAGVMFFEGYVSVTQDPDSIDNYYWNGLSEEERREYIEYYGSEKEAREVMSEALATSHISHETLHQLHTRFIPDYFKECGNFYYQRELEPDMDFHTYIGTKRTEIAADLYNQLIEEHGEDVHKVYFGSEIDPKKKDVIQLELFMYLSLAQHEGAELPGILNNTED